MTWIKGLITNPFLIVGLTSWAVAQTIKVIVNAVVNKKWDISKIFSDGDFPSGHSATVSSLATMSALVYGTHSYQFAFSAIFAIVVFRDAVGVRREAGHHAKIINNLFEKLHVEARQKLKESIGHTPIQVLAGSIIGLLCAFLLHYVVL